MGDKIEDIYAINYPLRLKYTSYSGDVVRLTTYLGLEISEGVLPLYLSFGDDYLNTSSLNVGRLTDVSMKDIEAIKTQRGSISKELVSKIKEMVEEFVGDYVMLEEDYETSPYKKQLKHYNNVISLVKSRVYTYKSHFLLALWGTISGSYLGVKYLSSIINKDLAFYLLLTISLLFFVFLGRLRESYFIKINYVIPSFYTFYFYITFYIVLYSSLLKGSDLKSLIGFGFEFFICLFFIIDYSFTWLRYTRKGELPFWTDFLSYHFFYGGFK